MFAFVTVATESDGVDINHTYVSMPIVADLEALHNAVIMRYAEMLTDDEKMRYRFILPVLEGFQDMEELVLEQF